MRAANGSGSPVIVERKARAQYREDARGRAVKSLYDWRAAKETERLIRLHELRQLLCVEFATGIDHVWLDHLDDEDEQEC